MSKRGKKGRRGVGHTTSILTVLFAIAPAAFVLTATPSGWATGTNVITALMQGTWSGIASAGWAIANVVTQQWVTILIMLAVAFVAIKVVRKMGAGVRITRHLKA